jgi:hypothetical protein
MLRDGSFARPAASSSGTAAHGDLSGNHQPGQQILARSYDFEYPARPGIAPNSQLPPLSSLSPARLGVVRLGNDQAAAKLIQDAGLA